MADIAEKGEDEPGIQPLQNAQQQQSGEHAQKQQRRVYGASACSGKRQLFRRAFRRMRGIYHQHQRRRAGAQQPRPAERCFCQAMHKPICERSEQRRYETNCHCAGEQRIGDEVEKKFSLLHCITIIQRLGNSKSMKFNLDMFYSLPILKNHPFTCILICNHQYKRRLSCVKIYIVSKLIFHN